MTAATLRKYQTYLYDEHGKPVIVQLDLRNKMMRKAYEYAMEELEDMMDAAEATKRLSDGSECRSFEEFAQEYLTHRNTDVGIIS